MRFPPASEFAAATPVTRDRYVDLLRVLSLAVVIIGHWSMATPVVAPDGSVVFGNALAQLPALQLLTWLFQVMPVFFFVGGFAHATAIDSLQRRGGTYADFIRSRAGRLLRPTAVFIACWLVIALLVEITGHDRGLPRLATRLVAQPLWFIGVYLGVVALAPVMLRLHRRHGPLVPAVLVAGTAVVDLLRFAAGWPYVAYLNVAFVWLAVHQLGYAYADGTLLRYGVRIPLALATAGMAAVIASATFGPYPVSMVGMPGAAVSNMFPPTLALLAHAAWLIGMVLLLREPVGRLLVRPGVWKAVVASGSVTMTAFLWHITALLMVIGGLLWAGLGWPTVGTAAWWLLWPACLAAAACVTVALGAVFRGAEIPRPTRIPSPASASSTSWSPPQVRDRLAVLGVVLSLIGVLGLSSVGFGGLLAGRTATLVVLPVTPASSTLFLAAGAGLIALTTPSAVPRRGVRPDGPRRGRSKVGP